MHIKTISWYLSELWKFHIKLKITNLNARRSRKSTNLKYQYFLQRPRSKKKKSASDPKYFLQWPISKKKKKSSSDHKHFQPFCYLLLQLQKKVEINHSLEYRAEYRYVCSDMMFWLMLLFYTIYDNFTICGQNKKSKAKVKCWNSASGLCL